MRLCFLILLLSLAILSATSAQSLISPPPATAPKVTFYTSIVHPLVTQYTNTTVYNFDGEYNVGFATGVNIIKSERLAYSFEITPFLRAANGTDRTNNLLFHPGIIFRYPRGFSFATRMAFETAGRYGATAVFSKVVAKTNLNNFFISNPVAE